MGLLSELILFSAEPGEAGELLMSGPLEDLLKRTEELVKPRKVLCIGGWGKSKNFPKMTGSKKLRKVFIENVMDVLKKYNLSGIDYDWEHPKTKAEETAYGKLIQESAERGITVSIAAAGWQKFRPEVFQYLTHVNIMCYDYPKKHSTLAHAIKDVEAFISMGCPPAKINLGVPFYGRHVDSRESLPYSKLKLKGSQEDLIDGYYFNNKTTLKAKAKLVKKMNLSGMMIWQIEQDDSDMTLLKILKSELANED